jgi:molybdopterin adenylyltransferase
MNGLVVGILVLSDRAARGERADGSGPALERWLSGRGVTTVTTDILADELDLIVDRLRDWADGGRFDLVLTCGGTGVSPRDVTPEATLAVVDRVVPGFGELMRWRSFEKSPHAAISRAVAGVRGVCLIVNLPGSPRAAVENLAAVWPAVPHAVAKIQGDPSDCGESAPS